jgi:hypothetical protein
MRFRFCISTGDRGDCEGCEDDDEDACSAERSWGLDGVHGVLASLTPELAEVKEGVEADDIGEVVDMLLRIFEMVEEGVEEDARLLLTTFFTSSLWAKS